MILQNIKLIWEFFGEESLIGERWAYDEETNECFIVDRDMEPISEYEYLLDDDEEDWEEKEK